MIAHEMKRTLHEVIIDPNTIERTESAEFRKSKARLKEDGHYFCYICGTTEDLQSHHQAEWMFSSIINFDKLKTFVEEWDIYGYGRLLKNQPLTTVDDVRCLVCLCQSHHTGVDHEDGGSGTGIHDMTFPSWIMQKLAKDNENPVPECGETAEKVLKDIESAPCGDTPQ
ncbi:conserved hypothetical protein [Candidatus Desulfosporosinus infrequens]|uniref:HNH endonuclease n=1 Tax=Candidatus Desulfosporosinus infrequens TaxID=2043169 RepID=A0A2U3LHE2_9FIRM|nr:conserved hypothetical protein [Candidatus Desulfosporosinus infrequens]